MKGITSRQLPYYLITIALFIGLAGPFLVGEGMFMDGLLYSVISNNLSHGSGTFWNLHLTETLDPEFGGHPPLVFRLQSLFYSAFGDGLYIDKLYSLFTIVLTVLLTIGIWRSNSDTNTKSYTWLPLFFWFLMPMTTWCAANNMLENTMMVFTTLSVFLILKSQNNYRIIFLLLSGFSIFLAFFSKGFVGLFPLSGPFWIWLFTRKFDFVRCLVDTFILSLALIIPMSIIVMFIPEGFDYFSAYIDKQVIGSLESVQTVDNRFYILWFLLQQIIPILILSGIVLLIKKRKRIETAIDRKKAQLYYAIGMIALSGIVPMMVSLKQRAFYLSATLPLIAIAFAGIMVPYIMALLNKYPVGRKANIIWKLFGITALIVTIILSFTFINKPARDKAMLNDIKTIIKEVPRSETISGEPNLYSVWSLHGYLKRYADINLHKGFNEKYSYFLTGRESSETPPPDYKEIQLNLKNYRLYQKELP
jgi:hypothetical protein